MPAAAPSAASLRPVKGRKFSFGDRQNSRGSWQTHAAAAPAADISPTIPTLRVGAAWALPKVLAQLGLDPETVLRECGLPADLFVDGDNRVTYPQLERLFLTGERLSGCD
jgi:hypothetical protein